VEIRTYTRLATRQHSFPQFTHWYIHRPTSEQSTHGCQNDQSSRRNSELKASRWLNGWMLHGSHQVLFGEPDLNFPIHQKAWNAC